MSEEDKEKERIRELNRIIENQQKNISLSNFDIDIPEDEKTNIYKEWNGMPEYICNDLSPIRSILVHFKSQEDINTFSKLINQPITEKIKFIYFPAKEKRDLTQWVYVNES